MAVRGSALLVPFILFMAGCVGGDAGPAAPPSVAGPATYSDDTGAISGLVTDEEINAIVGASVGLVELDDKVGVTDETGAFSISLVPPGTYTLAVQAIGYESKGVKVDVTLGETTEVKVILPVLPLDVPYPELLLHDGVIKNGVGVVRTATCTNCGTKETFQYLPKNKLPDDFAGLMVETTWKTQDYIGVDIVDREANGGAGASYWRIRSKSPIHYLVERCGDYTAAPHHAKSTFPCTPEQYEADQTQIENWYIGGYQQETHTLDPVCQQDIPGVVNGYKAGCYGVGFVAELRYTNYMTVFHKELPADVGVYTAIPDS